MQSEMYSRSDAERIAALRQELKDSIGPEQYLLEELGFNNLVVFAPKPADQLGEIFDKLTPEEVKAWSRIYLKRWSRNRNFGSWRSFSKYTPPLEVLHAIAEVRSLFDDLEIWEPPHDSNGYMLVGVVYGSAPEGIAADHFMIARWAKGTLGISFSELREDVVELGEIREKLDKQRLRRSWVAYLLVLTAVAVFIIALLH